PADRTRHLDPPAPTGPPVVHRRHLRLLGHHHAEPGPVLSVPHGNPALPLLRGLHHHRKDHEAMSARRVSREPYRIRKDPRELVVAVAVGLAIVLVTVVLVLVLAPGDTSTPVPDTSRIPQLPASTAPTGDTTPTTAPGG